MKCNRQILVFLGLSGSLVIILLACFAKILWLPQKRIRAYEEGYSRLTKGMTKEQVIKIMGAPASESEPPTPYWDDNLLNETNNISSAFRYSVRTVYLPVVYRLSFDTNQTLVGKHRY
jgi:hypothetical protein